MDAMTRRSTGSRYVLCVKNRGYEASLDLRRVYRLVEDDKTSTRGLVRLVDESSEDYLYPAKFFVPIDVPKTAARVFSKVSA
jgi:hypothetical protein